MTPNRAQQQRIFDSYKVGIGEDILAALRDSAVTEIKVGADDRLFLKRGSQLWEDSGNRVTLDQRRYTLNIIASQMRGKPLNEASPLLEGKLPLTGDRIQGWGPPVADYALVIRRHADTIFTLEDYVAAGICTAWQAETLREHVLKGSNILVSGAVDSGKTTLVNALLLLLIGTEHLIYIEDTEELQGQPQNFIRLKTADSRATLQDIVRSSLRGNPDRLVIGEVRGEEMIDLIEAWNKGRRGGVATIHAGSAAAALHRIGHFYHKAKMEPQWHDIEAAIDLIVHIEMTATGRKISELMEVHHGAVTEKIPIGLTKLGPPSAVDQPSNSHPY